MTKLLLPDTRTSGVIPFAQTPRHAAPRSARPFRLAVVGCAPPRRCGIATFTSDMVSSIQAASPAAVVDVYAMAGFGEEAIAGHAKRLIIEDDRDSHAAAGRAIEAANYDAVWVQHEFGIFGGASGDMLIDLLRPVSAPLIVTLHTVLDQPSDEQRRVMDWLVAHAARLVVMSRRAETILCDTYGADPQAVALIEHGVPDRPFGRGEAMKRRFGLDRGRVLLTFGLISPGKGIEVAISALQHIVPHYPDTTYVIAGATHPRLLAREGESYRLGLKQLAEEIGVARNIRWIEDFLEFDELIDLIEAADIYLTPYSSPLQATSGTLSYAVALGKAVVSTPYVHASELLAPDVGLLTPFGDSLAMAGAIADLLGDPQALIAMQHRAYRRGRAMTWANFGAGSVAVIEEVRVRAGTLDRVAALPSGRALDRLCDDTGILQHSLFGVADRAHGYCVDDNARALMLANISGPDFAARAPTFASFVQHAWNPETRRFRNFMRFDRSWCEDAGSEDSCGRTLWAIGATTADGPVAAMRDWALNLWRQTAVIAGELKSPRAIAFAMLGAERVLEGAPTDPLALDILAAGASRLTAGLDHYARPDWRWFEPVLSYDNCRLPQALLAAGARLDDPQMADAAIGALEWIVDLQTGITGHFRPVGSEGFGTPYAFGTPFDQQPVDAWATVDAAVAAWRHTRERQWIRVAKSAHAWFFGANDRGVAVGDIKTGECFDAVTPRGVNRNQGAESVLALHLASRAMRALLSQAEPAGNDAATPERMPA